MVNRPTNIFRGRTFPHLVRSSQIKQYLKSKDVELINCYMAIDLDYLLALEWYNIKVPTYAKRTFIIVLYSFRDTLLNPKNMKI